MKFIKKIKDALLIGGMAIASTNVFALTKSDVPSNSSQGELSGVGGASAVKTGIGSVIEYLKYALWAASALGIIAVAFMLFNNVQDTVLKHVAKIVGIICILALAFTVPGFFGLNITL